MFAPLPWLTGAALADRGAVTLRLRCLGSTGAKEPFSDGLATFKRRLFPACLCDLIFFHIQNQFLHVNVMSQLGKGWDTTSQELLGNISSSIAKRKTTVSVLTSPLPDTVSALAVQQFLALRQYWCQIFQERIKDMCDSSKYPEP